MVRFAKWSDRRLLAAVQSGEGEAFGAFFERHADAVSRYVRRRTSGPEEAADLVAETFAAALQSVHRGNAARVSEGAPWLIGIARNKLTDSYRRGAVDSAARHALSLERAPLTADDVLRLNSEIGDHGLPRAIAELTDEERQALIERIVLERDYAEIAHGAQQSEVVIRKRVSRALVRLRSSMGARS